MTHHTQTVQRHSHELALLHVSIFELTESLASMTVVLSKNEDER
jgi:hypothetical protein